jgi:hypothetical protein
MIKSGGHSVISVGEKEWLNVKRIKNTEIKQMPRFLCIERPHQDAEIVEWSVENLAKYKLDFNDAAQMESGVVIWIDEVAYTMEEDDAQIDAKR